jgi:hypothetical protein
VHAAAELPPVEEAVELAQRRGFERVVLVDEQGDEARFTVQQASGGDPSAELVSVTARKPGWGSAWEARIQEGIH